MKSYLCGLLIVAAVLASNITFSSSVVAQQAGVVCPKCGKVHSATTTSVVQASATMPQASSGGVSNVLSTLNSQRARQGIGQLGSDPALQAVAERRAIAMARSGRKSHPPGSFSPGRYEGVGWSSSYSPSGVSACFTSDNRMRVAGAAMATGRDGVYFAVVYR